MYVKKKNSDKKRYRSIRQQNPFQKQHGNTAAAAREEPPEISQRVVTEYSRSQPEE